MKRSLIAATAAALATTVLAVPAPVSASVPARGHTPTTERIASTEDFTLVTAPGLVDHVSSVRTPDGVLHLAYLRSVDHQTYVTHTAVSPDGRVLGHTDVVGPPWAVYDFMAAIWSTPSGALRISFDGQGPGAKIYEYPGVRSAVSTDGGVTWALPQESQLKNPGYSRYSFDALSLADGTPVTARPGTYRIGSFTDWEATSDDLAMDGPGVDSAPYGVRLARAGDAVFAAYGTLSSTAAHLGTFVQQLTPVVRPRVKAPGSDNSATAQNGNRAALATSARGAVYLAYCAGSEGTCRRINLWNVSTGTVTATIATKGNVFALDLAAGSDGRMWVSWRSASGELTVVRTNPAVTRAGSPTVVTVPDAIGNFIRTTTGESSGGLDVVVGTIGAAYLTQVRPSLTLEATPRRWRAGRTQRVVVRVSDANDPVSGARARLGGQSCRTNDAGTCSIRLRINQPRQITVKATKAGYEAASDRLRVTRAGRQGRLITTPRTATPQVAGTLIASPSEVGPGRAILFTGRIGGNLPRRVALQVRGPDGWTRSEWRTTRREGLFRFTYRAPVVTGTLWFRVRMAASPHLGLRAAVTPTRRVRVTG